MAHPFNSNLFVFVIITHKAFPGKDFVVFYRKGCDYLQYTIIRSRRKTVSLQITPEGEVMVRCPSRMPKWQIQQFVDSRQSWIEAHLKKIAQRPPQPKLTEPEMRALAKQAAEDLARRISRFAPIVGVSCGRITIRSQKTRWGSCSGKGNLNFNCLLMLAPEAVRDYVVVHELCHRKEMNHSTQFWLLVETILPDYRVQKQWLKDNGNALLARLPD